MKENKSLLEMINNIDDSFIEEAAHPEILLHKKKRILGIHKIGTLAACMVIAVGLVAAVPYMKASEKNEPIDISPAVDAENIDLVASSIVADKAAQDAKDAALAESIAKEKAENAAALKKAQEEAAAADAAAKASQAAKEAADAAAKAASEAAKKAQAEAAAAKDEASKAAEEASKAAGVASQVQSVMTESTDQVVSDIASSESLQDIEAEGIRYVFSENVIYELIIGNDMFPADLAIPEMLSGEQIVALAEDFWSFCEKHSALKTVTIPKNITEFGDIAYLPKTVVICCEKDSPAAEFFGMQGYSIQIIP